MTAENVLKQVRDAYRNDYGIPQPLQQALSDAINDSGTDLEVRGQLKELGAALTRQADARRERQRVADEQERAREHAAALAARDERWQALPAFEAMLFNAIAEHPQDRTLRALLKQARSPSRGPAPATFEPELVPPPLRLPGFGG
jgi:hypothetical protein